MAVRRMYCRMRPLIRPPVRRRVRARVQRLRLRLIDPRGTHMQKTRLLSGGNPQIPKGDGDAPVQADIAAMPGWKHAVGRQLDALIARTVPGVRKAVRWNSPFYGIEGRGWFLSFHCFTKYVKVTFLNGASLRPVPPVASRHEHVRYFRVHEADEPDEDLLVSWLEQASTLPGEELF